MTFDYTPAAGGVQYTQDKSVTCTYNGTGKATCSGPQGTVFLETVCSMCGAPADTSGLLRAQLSTASCSSGYAKDGAGTCRPINPNSAYFPCPPGTVYDDTTQYCLDNTNGRPVSDLCPTGTLAYVPESHYCLPFRYPLVQDCETFSMWLGTCPPPVVHPTKSASCVKQACLNDLVWDPNTCGCINP